eukprot:3628079-Alexandrium_andersonii.AAC.1
MSASLVGSEMCIRDRSHAVFTIVPDIAKYCHQFGNMPSQCIGTKKAVSYTHLTLPTICSV